MKIFIMRHGESEIFAKSDAERPLTQFGQQSSHSQGIWLKNTALSFDKVLVSPFVRAQQTFALVNQVFEQQLTHKMETWDGITPYGSAEVVASYLNVLRAEGVKQLLLISHLPLVSDIILELCGKNNVSFLPATIAELEWNEDRATILQSKRP
ncbi:phosphohistidine phosphatase SixA [Pasteurellaceae bacterium 22721_9_1]